MKYILLFGILFMGDLSAKGGDRFEIKIGNAVLKGVMPGKRSSSAPDIPVRREFDICGWLDEEKNQKHNAQRELLRKLWDFKRFFRARSGSLVFTISIANNLDYENNLQLYYQWLANNILEDLKEYKDSDYTDHNSSKYVGYSEFEINNHLWIKYNADNNSTQYYRTLLDKNIVLRLNFIQSDIRKNSVIGQWHPEAEKLAKEIFNSISLELPYDGKLCDCID